MQEFEHQQDIINSIPMDEIRTNQKKLEEIKNPTVSKITNQYKAILKYSETVSTTINKDVLEIIKDCPPLLNKSEEQKYLYLMQQGDKNARKTLIEHNLRGALHIVRRYATGYTEFEDLISIGTIGLIKAIDTYNKKNSDNLRAYILRCVNNEILMFLRSPRKNKNEALYHELIGREDEKDSITLMDEIINASIFKLFKQLGDICGSEVSKDAIITRLENLPDRFIINSKKTKENHIIDLDTGDSIPVSDLNSTFGILDIFDNITEEEIFGFYNQLCKYPMLGLNHPIGRKILAKINDCSLIRNKNFTVFRARKRDEKQERPWTESEMLSPPYGKSTH